MKSCITLSLVSSLKGGPWVLWDDLADGLKNAAQMGFDMVELFTEGPKAGMSNELKDQLNETGLGVAAVGTGAGKVLKGLTLTDGNPDIRANALSFIREMIDFGAEYNAPAIIGSMQGAHGGEVSRDQAIAWLQQSLEELGEHASRQGVTLIYEPLNRYKTKLFNH